MIGLFFVFAMNYTYVVYDPKGMEGNIFVLPTATKAIAPNPYVKKQKQKNILLEKN